MWATYVILSCLVATLEKVKKSSETNFIILFQNVINIKILRYFLFFFFFFLILSLWNLVCTLHLGHISILATFQVLRATRCSWLHTEQLSTRPQSLGKKWAYKTEATGRKQTHYSYRKWQVAKDFTAAQISGLYWIPGTGIICLLGNLWPHELLWDLLEISGYGSMKQTKEILVLRPTG